MASGWRSAATTRLLSQDRTHDTGPSPGGQPLVVRVSCRSTPDRRIAPHYHPATIRSDWSVAVPHDLASERIAAALGGYSSCLGLVDHVVPALRAWIGLHLRAMPVDVRLLPGSGRWRVGQQAACCHGRQFDSVGEAASHARSLAHLGALHGADSDVLSTVAAACWGTYGGGAGPRGPQKLMWRAAACCRAGARDLEYLWDVGLSPATIVRIRERTAAIGPLPRRFYVGVATCRPDLGWVSGCLAATSRHGADAYDPAWPLSEVRETRPGHLVDRPTRPAAEEPLVSWLAWTAAPWDRADPTARPRWLALGVSRPMILELGAAGFDPDEVAAYAASVGLSPDAAARSI